MRLGSTTLAFFRKGEELEATGFDAVPHDDPTLVPPKLAFRGFDRVPRNYGPLLIALLVVVLAALTVLGWQRVRQLPGDTTHAASVVRGKAAGEVVRLKAAVGSSHVGP